MTKKDITPEFVFWAEMATMVCTVDKVCSCDNPFLSNYQCGFSMLIFTGVGVKRDYYKALQYATIAKNSDSRLTSALAYHMLGLLY